MQQYDEKIKQKTESCTERNHDNRWSYDQDKLGIKGVRIF